MRHSTLIAGLQKSAELAGDGERMNLCARALMGDRSAIADCLALCRLTDTEKATETLELAKVEIDLALEKLKNNDFAGAVRDLRDVQACLTVVLKNDMPRILDSILNPSRADEIAMVSLKRINDDGS